MPTRGGIKQPLSHGRDTFLSTMIIGGCLHGNGRRPLCSKQPVWKSSLFLPGGSTTVAGMTISAWTLGWALIVFWPGHALANEEKQNVLFIISDDMRVEPGCYGGRSQTPHLDQLAEEGVLFERSYCNYPLCNPSRASMLSGLYPTETGVLGNRDNLRKLHPELVTLPQAFKENGYRSLASGKVFHGSIPDAVSWSREEIRNIEKAQPKGKSQSQREKALSKSERSDRIVVLEGDGSDHPEHRLADRAITMLEKYGDEPFFLTVGFSQPHSAPTAPRKFFDLYPLDSIQLPKNFASARSVPEDFPEGAFRERNADLFIGREASEEEARKVIQAYLAAVTWVDWNIGRVLAALEKQGLADDTIVVFWSDHGYQLGENGKWSKAGSLFEMTARVPFIIRDPKADGNGVASPRVVEAVDIYPTLIDLCGIEAPHELSGRSLRPLLEKPRTPWPHSAYTVWSEDGETLKGLSIRTEEFRYARFTQPEAGEFLTRPDEDPLEQRNLVKDPEHSGVVDVLKKKLRAFEKNTFSSE